MNTNLLRIAALAAFSLSLLPGLALAGDAGKADYDMYCASCHGATGGGDGVAGQALDPKPANFQTAEFWKTRDDALVTKAIKEGGAAIGKSSMMVAWGAVLDDGKIAAVVKYMKTFKK